ncbi:MAG: hypothetical protein Q8K36_04280 [Alphaproteobacteria bacterium]|nr:hypothetical protein [Alphaproteobacteria bacterium]
MIKKFHLTIAFTSMFYMHTLNAADEFNSRNSSFVSENNSVGNESFFGEETVTGENTLGETTIVAPSEFKNLPKDAFINVLRGYVRPDFSNDENNLAAIESCITSYTEDEYNQFKEILNIFFTEDIHNARALKIIFILVCGCKKIVPGSLELIKSTCADQAQDNRPTIAQIFCEYDSDKLSMPEYLRLLEAFIKYDRSFQNVFYSIFWVFRVPKPVITPQFIEVIEFLKENIKLDKNGIRNMLASAKKMSIAPEIRELVKPLWQEEVRDINQRIMMIMLLNLTPAHQRNTSYVNAIKRFVAESGSYPQLINMVKLGLLEALPKDILTEQLFEFLPKFLKYLHTFPDVCFGFTIIQLVNSSRYEEFLREVESAFQLSGRPGDKINFLTDCERIGSIAKEYK